MTGVIVTGAMGRMGSITLEKLQKDGDLFPVAGVDPAAPEGQPRCLDQVTADAQVLIDFSFHTATPGIMAWAAEHNVAVVMCTTGHTPEEVAAIRAAGEKIPVFYSANMSVGVALLAQLAKKTAQVFPDADIEIVETHHNRKADAPSGTALMLGKQIQSVRPDSKMVTGRSGMSKRTPEEIGIHAIRRGNVPGIHEVIVSTDSQCITLRHEVYDRALFADGALAAAKFLTGKAPGIYDMTDMLR